MQRLADNPAVARVLANPAGRVGYAAVFGLLFFECLNSFRGLMEMAVAWQQHYWPLPAPDDAAMRCSDPLAEEVARGQTPPLVS